MGTFGRSLLGFLVLSCAGYAFGDRTSTQRPYGVCIYETDANRLQLKFTLDLQSDPTGALEVYNTNTQCNFPLSGTKYELEVNLDNYGSGQPNPATGENGCGFSYMVTKKAVTWVFFYYEIANRPDVDYGLNRIYTVTCDDDTVIGNQVDAQISVSTPNLNSGVTPYRPNIRYYITKETSAGTNVYTEVGSTPVAVQTRLRLVLEYDYGTFDGNRYNAIAGLLTTIANNAQMTSSKSFLDINSCGTGDHIPTGGLDGFERVTSSVSGKYVVQTDPFPAFKFDGRSFNFVYFRTKIDFCVQLDDAKCVQPCVLANSRRRRSTGNDTDDFVTASVQIVDSLGDVEEQKSTETLLYAALGACIAICVLLTVLLCVYLLVVRRRRRNNPENKLHGYPNHDFVNSK